MEQQKDIAKLLADLGCKRSLAQFDWAMCTAINSRSASGGMNIRTCIEFGVGPAPAARPAPPSDGIELWEGPMAVDDAIALLCSERPIEFSVGGCRIARFDHFWRGYSPMELGYGYQVGSPPRFIATTESSAGAAGSPLKEMLKGARVASVDGPCFLDAVQAAAWWFRTESREKAGNLRSGELEVHIPLDPGLVRRLRFSAAGALRVELEPGLPDASVVLRLATDESSDGAAVVGRREKEEFIFDDPPTDFFTIFVFLSGQLHAHCTGHARQVPVDLPESLAGDLKQLILHGEGEHVEFKEAPPKPPKDWSSTEWQGMVKTVLAFGNYGGGNLLVGVTDDGGIVGIDSTLASLGGTLEQRVASFEQLFRKHLTEGVQWSPRVHFYCEQLDEKPVLLVQVEPNPPQQIACLSGHAYARAGSTTRRATEADYRTLHERERSSFPFRSA